MRNNEPLRFVELIYYSGCSLDPSEVFIMARMTSVCEVPVELNKVGVVLLGGLNPVAAAEEAGIGAENYAMSTVMEYRDLVKFQELIK